MEETYGRTSMNLRVVLPGCLSLLLAGALAQAAEAPDLDQVRAGGFTVTAPDGRRAPLSSLLPEDKPAVVEFWATWCTPCRKSLPSLEKLYTRHGSEEITVLALTIEDFDSDKDKVEKFVSEEGLTFPIAFAPRESFLFMNQRDEVAVPKILVYDADGQVVEHIISYSFRTSGRVEKAVTRALSKNKK